MPRTTTVECSGCPPLRALTFDVLGYIKVIETPGYQRGVPRVVERWGEPDPLNCVLAAAIEDREHDPILAVARKSGQIEVRNPLNGDICSAVLNDGDTCFKPGENDIVGLHVLAENSSSRSCSLLTCTTKGHMCIKKSMEDSGSSEDSSKTCSVKWNICDGGNILCSEVDGREKFALFGGKGVELNMWDIAECKKIWSAKPSPKNSLGIFTPTWFTCTAFLSKDDHHKLVAGTNNHQVRLYDIRVQRRPVFSIDFRETPIKSVAADIDGNKIYFGNGSGDLASIDIRTRNDTVKGNNIVQGGQLSGCFLGKCSGSIKSIARHPTKPMIASCGLDSYVRFWDTENRQLLSAVYLKQHLTNVVFTSKFINKEGACVANEMRLEEPSFNETDSEEEVKMLPVKRKVSKEKANQEKKKRNKAEQNEGKKKKAKGDKGDEKIFSNDDEGSKPKCKKKNKRLKHENLD